jgi:hypothetical protein
VKGRVDLEGSEAISHMTVGSSAVMMVITSLECQRRLAEGMFEVLPSVSIEVFVPTCSKADGQFCSSILFLDAIVYHLHDREI